MTDAQILDLYFARDEQAIAETAGKYGPYCHTVAYQILHSNEDAEECVSDTYLAAWESIPPTRPSVFRLFLAKITRSKAINLYHAHRAKKRGGGELPLVLEELAECVSDRSASGPEEEILATELSKTIDRFLRSQPERDADLFVRRYFFTEPVKKIASDFRISESAVSVALHRIRKRLYAHLEKEGYVL